MNARSGPTHRLLDDTDQLVDELTETLAGDASRFLLGITGPPGSGKSRLAARVTEQAAAALSSTVAPMDGFHRSNDELVTRGLLELKGVPASFDAEGFVANVRRLRDNDGPVVWPTYDRTQEEVVASGSVIEPETRLIVIEGNYLLLDTAPWSQIRPLLDAVWYLDVSDAILIPRLRRRHEHHRSAHDAWTKVQSTDLPNAALVASTRDSADVILAAG